MSLWNTFTSGIGPIAKRLTGGGSYLSPEEQAKEEALNSVIKDALANIDAKGKQVGWGYDITKKTTKGVGDVLLKTAVAVHRNVLSPYIFRPLSTISLLTDTKSPLYKPGEYEQGFQFSDIKAAYNRSAKVSTFQALTKSEFTPINSLSSLVLPTGKIDIDKVDLWNDESIKKNFVDNAVGRWYTGIGDFLTGTKALTVAGKAAKAGVVAGVGKPLGLSTAGKTTKMLGVDMENGIAFAQSNGAKGVQTISGNHAVVLAESKDWGTITDLVSRYSTNEKLIPLIYETTDPTVVKNLILADKGDLVAMETLAKTAPDKLFDAADTASHLRNKYLTTGSSYIPEGPAVPRLKAAYDAAIAKDPQFVKIRDAFFDENYNIKLGGKAYTPAEPIYGTAGFIKAGEVVREMKNARRFREKSALRKNEKINKFGEVLETKLGLPGRATVNLVKWSVRQGEYKPLGFVTFSGMRPLDGRIELNAFLNNLKIFRNGEDLIEVKPGSPKVKVADIRRDFESRYMNALGKNEVQVLEEIDAEIGKMLAYKAGWYNEKEIAAHIAQFRKNINVGMNSVKQIGYGIGHDGSQIFVDPQTIRGMAESYRFTPWDNIEGQIARAIEPSKLKAGKNVVQVATKGVFRELNRIWTFDVLVRPMYIIKQSLLEPIVSTTLASGINFLRNDIMKTGIHGAQNAFNWHANKLSNIVNLSERKAIAAAVRDKQKMLAKAEEIKNIAQASLEDLLSGTASPAAKAQHLAAARKDLAAADALLDALELDLRAAVVPYGVKEAIPSMATLERRIAFIESRPMSKAAAAKVNKAKKSIAHYRTVINKLATNKQVIKQADDEVYAAYKEIDGIIAQLKPALQEQANSWGKSAKWRKRYYAPSDTQYRMVNGEYVSIESFTAGPAPFSAAVRAEVANARTTDLNILGDISVGMRKALTGRKIPNAKVSVSDPLYFSELEYLANRIIRQDPLMDLILAETPASELARWATSDAGIAYMKAFEVFDPKQYASYIADKVALIHRTFPTIESRAAVLSHEVTAQELQGLLANNIDELYDIVPSNYNYGAASLSTGKFGGINNIVDNATSAVFRKMASFENPIRNAYFDKIAIDEVARRAEILISQGVKMTPERYNALRQAASREAIQELEKTVYTIRRQNRLLHNARWAVAFPTATVNAFYRYARLAAKNPERGLGFLYNYGRAFENFGVDENGNPTNDMSKITHLIVPGTKEMGWGNAGEGIALSSRSLGFLLNQPSPSFITALSVGKLMQTFPGTEQGIKDMLNIGGTDYYSLLFPYGAPTSLTKQFTPPWLNAFWNAATGPQGKADYLSSWSSVYNYHHMLYEMGVEKNPPTDKQIEDEVKKLWWTKTLSAFASPAGVPFKVETNPMRLPSNLYYKLLEKYIKEGKDNATARALAGDEMIGLLGTKFMVDRITFTGSTRNLNIPATYEAYKRVFEENDALVAKLAAIDPNDINVVSLLAGDLSRDPTEKSNNITALLSDPKLTLPGTSRAINSFKLTPAEVERERIKQRTWDQYNLVKDAIEAKITDGKTLRAHPELKAALEQTVETYFKNQSQAWYDEYMMAQTGDTAYKYARALSMITTDEAWMKKHGNTDFWNDAKVFMQARDMFALFYQSIPDYDPRKATIREGYNTWVEMNAAQWNPNLQYVIKTYFSNDNLKYSNDVLKKAVTK